MNAYPDGTRVFFFGSAGEVKYGTVQSTSRMADGTQFVTIAVDGENKTVSLPVATVQKVT